MQRLGGLREAARLDDPDESAHRIEAIHECVPRI
jgi:hypothetical protein